MRLIARPTRVSTSSCVGAGAGWNIWLLPSPSGEYTPSRKMVCRCRLSRRSLLARWMTVTAPVSPAGRPRSVWRRLYHLATLSVKMRTTWPSSFPSKASGKRSGKGIVTTNCRRGTSGKT